MKPFIKIHSHQIRLCMHLASVARFHRLCKLRTLKLAVGQTRLSRLRQCNHGNNEDRTPLQCDLHLEVSPADLDLG